MITRESNVNHALNILYNPSSRRVFQTDEIPLFWTLW